MWPSEGAGGRVPGSGNSQCKGPEGRVWAVSSGIGKEADGLARGARGEAERRAERGWGRPPQRLGLAGSRKDFGFSPEEKALRLRSEQSGLD